MKNILVSLILLLFIPLSVFAENKKLAVTNKQLCPPEQTLHQKLKKGDKNGLYSTYQKENITEVKILQAHLNRLGYGSGSVDGVIGPITEGAIKRMQSFLEVVPDGIVGPFTIAAINKSCVASSDTVEIIKGDTKEYSEQEKREIIDELEKKVEELIKKKDEIIDKLKEQEKQKTLKEINKPYIVYSVEENSQIVPDNKDDIRDIDIKIWEMLLGVMGKEYVKENIRNFILFDNEENDFSAYVVKTDRWKKWDITVNVAMVDFSKGEDDELMDTLIHEFNHIFSLNLEEVNPKTIKEDCEVTYWTGEGCAYASSYINNFTRKFWNAEDLDRQFSEELIENGQDKMEEIFKEIPNKYNSYYSVVNPIEDMAESFTLFVTNDVRSNKKTTANKKINFFYDFEDIVEMRTRIRVYLDTL